MVDVEELMSKIKSGVWSTQDAFECIFRRGIMGVMVSEVEDEGIEKICQKKTKSIL